MDQNFDFPVGSRIALYGGSGQGKSWLATQIIRQSYFEVPPSAVHVYTRGNTDQFDHLVQSDSRVRVFEEYPPELKNESGGHLLCFFDDVSSSCRNADLQKIENITTYMAHHNTISALIALHAFFWPGTRSIRLGCTHHILFENPADRSVLTKIACQWFPRRQSEFFRAAEDAFSEPFGHLMFTASTGISDRFRLRSRITQNPSILYELQ